MIPACTGPLFSNRRVAAVDLPEDDERGVILDQLGVGRAHPSVFEMPSPFNSAEEEPLFDPVHPRILRM